jgi:hypothetical protein
MRITTDCPTKNPTSNYIYLNISFSHLKVDELEIANYNDTNFWRKNSLSLDTVTDILKDLEI